MKTFIASCLPLASSVVHAQRQPGINQLPHLKKIGNNTQLVVEGEPFLIFGGEFGNSSASTINFMQPYGRSLRKLTLVPLLRLCTGN